MKIVDNFLFYGELDTLELKLETLYDFVDKFVIVESDHTFSNVPKDYILESNFSRFSFWAKKILYLKVKSPKYNNPWDNEFWSRDQFKIAWGNLQRNDVVLISDCDEIARPEAITYIKSSQYDYYGLICPIFNFKFNYLNTKNEYTIWITAYRYDRNVNYKPSLMRRVAHEQNIFRKRYSKAICLHHAGWHFSSLGDNEFVKNKLKSFSHTEFNNPKFIDNVNISKHINENKNHINQSPGSWRSVKLDSYFPKIILENNEKYKSCILEDGDKTVLDYYKHKILSEEK
jgi:beta-1,4-mannosyl-glycoprotein beta-1,4-N-acetylglucosaminyltransferase